MERNLTGLKRLIRAKTAIGTLPEITEYTATGNPATFSTNLIQPLQAFEIPFMPVQSGSGDPSPDNVRPISGWPGVTVTANGQTILVAWESVAGVVYGGTVDLVTGVMTVDTVNVIYDGVTNAVNDVDYGTTADGRIYVLYINRNHLPGSIANEPAWCNQYKWVDGHLSTLHTGEFNTYEAYFRFVIVDQTLNTVTKYNQYLEEHPLQIVYPISTPQTVQLTPVEIKTIIGQNSIATNTAGTNTIKYLKRG